MHQAWGQGMNRKEKTQQADQLSHMGMAKLVLLSEVQTFGNAQSSPSSSSAPFLPVPHWLKHTPWAGKNPNKDELNPPEDQVSVSTRQCKPGPQRFQGWGTAAGPCRVKGCSSPKGAWSLLLYHLFVQLIILHVMKEKKNGNLCCQMTKKSCTTKPLLQKSSPLHTASCLCLVLQNEV